MVFVPFTAIDNHQRSVTVGSGLLKKETTEAYGWLLRAFKKAFVRPPNIVVTDQDGAMRLAVAAEFPESKHSFAVLYHAERIPAKFEDRWNKLMEEFNLVNHKWLSKMYRLRSSWGPPSFFVDSPLCGLMRTTSRSRARTNSFFSYFTSSGSTLVKFMLCYESAMERQRYTQEKLDHQSFDSFPALLTPLPIEVHAANVYTRSLFIRVQKEIVAGSWLCSITGMSLDEGCTVCIIDEEKIKPVGLPEVIDKESTSENVEEEINLHQKFTGHYKIANYDIVYDFLSLCILLHEENSNLIKKIRASTDAAIRNQGASIKTLEIQIGQMSKVLQERGFGSLPSSTEANLRDLVKSISTTIEADSNPIRSMMNEDDNKGYQKMTIAEYMEYEAEMKRHPWGYAPSYTRSLGSTTLGRSKDLENKHHFDKLETNFPSLPPCFKPAQPLTKNTHEPLEKDPNDYDLYVPNSHHEDEEVSSDEDVDEWLNAKMDKRMTGGYDVIYGKEKSGMLKQWICFRDHERYNVRGIEMIFVDFLKVRYENKKIDDKPRLRDNSFEEWVKIKLGHTDISETIKCEMFKEWVKENFNFEVDFGRTRDDPYSKRFDVYKEKFDSEIKQLANEYDLKVGMKKYALDDIWEKCERFQDTACQWHDEGFEEEERWESGIEKTCYTPPFVKSETFEVKRYSFKIKE
ncbi:FAR1-related sequence 5-like protein [Tanacetum coccineum]